ncbi:MAG: ATP-binding protein [Thermoplasmata archaeon]
MEELTPLIGRDAELATLNRHLADAMAGKGSTLLISGEPGIGKTTLVEEFRKCAEAEGARTLSGAALSDSAHPFQVFSKALEGVTDKPLFEEQEYTSFTEIFAVNGAGLLLAKASSKEGGLDADIFAGMLSAVQDFVRDSFGQEGKKAGLGRLEYGDMKILIEHSQHLFLTAVFSGTEHPDMKNTVKQALKKIEERHGQLIEGWTGKMSEIAPVQNEITKLAGAKFLVRRDLEGIKLENERLRIADRALEALVRLSGDKVLLLLLEDFHWADESSLFVLQYLARNISKSRILLLGTSRPGESDALQKAIESMKGEEILDRLIS